jgi:hypothetical protein
LAVFFVAKEKTYLIKLLSTLECIPIKTGRPYKFRSANYFLSALADGFIFKLINLAVPEELAGLTQ